MKHLNVVGKLFLSLCMLCTFAACSSDDDDDKKVDSIVGEWQFDKYELNIDPNTTEIKEAIEKIIDDLISEDIAKNIATIKDDKTYTIISSNGNNIDKGSYSLSGDQLTLNPGKPGSLKLTIAENNGGKLILDIDLTQVKDEYPGIAEAGIKSASIRLTYNAK